VRQQQGWGVADSTQGERIWSSLGRHSVKRGLLVIHFLCVAGRSGAFTSKLISSSWTSLLFPTWFFDESSLRFDRSDFLVDCQASSRTVFFCIFTEVFLPVVLLFPGAAAAAIVAADMTAVAIAATAALTAAFEVTAAAISAAATVVAAAAVVNCWCCLVAAGAVVTTGCRCRCCCSFLYHCVFTGEAEAAGIVGMGTAAALTLVAFLVGDQEPTIS
jgi:hypothetical protein